MPSEPEQPRPPSLSIDTFRSLIAASVEFCELAPWDYLSDSDLFGIHDAKTGNVRLASVMGNAGQVFGLMVHRGEQGLRWALTTTTRDDYDHQDPNFVHGQDGLMLEFVPRRELEAYDLALLKQIGFKPLSRAPRKWLKFRSYMPGTAPWYLDQDEAESLLADLQKTTVFARLMKENKKLLQEGGNKVPFQKKAGFVDALAPEDLDWQELVLAPQPLPKPVVFSDSERAAVASLPRNSDLVLELDCVYSPGLVTEGSRPYFPWLSMAVNAHDGTIHGTAMDNNQKKGPEHVAAQCLLRTLIELECRPREIAVSRYSLAVALKQIADFLDIAVFKISCLPWFDLAYRDLRRAMKARRKYD